VVGSGYVQTADGLASFRKIHADSTASCCIATIFEFSARLSVNSARFSEHFRCDLLGQIAEVLGQATVTTDAAYGSAHAACCRKSDHGPDGSVEPQDVFAGHLFSLVSVSRRNGPQQFYVLTDVLVDGGQSVQEEAEDPSGQVVVADQRVLEV